MNHALNEVKQHAKRYLKYLKREQQSLVLPKWYRLDQKEINSETVQLKHCQLFMATVLGARDWNQLRTLLTAAQSWDTQDFGNLFHKPACDVFLNHWFADYKAARQQLVADTGGFLLPFRKQFMVVTQDYLDTLNIYDELSQQWQTINHDLVAGYGTQAWDLIARNTVRNKLSAIGP